MIHLSRIEHFAITIGLRAARWMEHENQPNESWRVISIRDACWYAGVR